MTFNHRCPHFLSVVVIFLSIGGIRAQEPDSSQPKQAPPQAQTDQERDPLQRPLGSQQGNKSRREKESKHYRDWKREVQWIIADDELAAFNKLGTDVERDNFIEIFWKHRDPTPDTEENEYKDEFYRRKAYANEHFSAGIPGELTDRGHMYILYGKPDSIESHPMGGPYLRPAEEGGGSTETYPFEIWRYRDLGDKGQEVMIEFVDVCGCGEYRKTTNRSDKDALKNVPNAGLTDLEAMGRVNKADRSRDPEGLGQGLFNQNNSTKELDRIQQDALLERAPAPRALNTAVTSIVRYHLLPFDVRVDFVKGTSDTVLVPITVQVPNRELTFVNKDGVQRGVVNIFGRLTTLTGKVAQTFEDTVRVDLPQEVFEKGVNNAALYWKALPMRPGRYRLDIVAKDVNGDKLGSFSRGIVVPVYSEDQLSASSLILADALEPLAMNEVGTGNFVIGATKIWPKVQAAGKTISFRHNQNMGLWMQIYNLAVDGKTGKTAFTVQYEVIDVTTNQPVMKMSESKGQIGSAGNQFLQKSLPLGSLAPGEYQVTVKVNDLVVDRSISPVARFMVE
ncbi:MAG TPA: GWxTD domain-containing protein [Candidatus Angelobacter sp.]|nr:GWxTD domain-containing protein [Candidatus Angelobacter sp.]